MFKKFKDRIRTYFFAGLLTILPLSITVYVVVALLGVMDKILNYLPASFRPRTYLPFNIPGIGLLLSLIIVIITGVLVKNYVGGKIVSLGERIVYRTPLIRTIYSSVKQLIQAMIVQDSKSFKRVVVIEYPRKGIYSVAFVTGIPTIEVAGNQHQEMLNVFVPTTPNPTSGFYLMVPKDDSFPLNISVEDAFKLIISGGIVSPGQSNEIQPDRNSVDEKRENKNDEGNGYVTRFHETNE